MSKCENIICLNLPNILVYNAEILLVSFKMSVLIILNYFNVNVEVYNYILAFILLFLQQILKY